MLVYRCCDLTENRQGLEAKVVIQLLCKAVMDSSWVG